MPFYFKVYRRNTSNQFEKIENCIYVWVWACLFIYSHHKNLIFQLGRLKFQHRRYYEIVHFYFFWSYATFQFCTIFLQFWDCDSTYYEYQWNIFFLLFKFRFLFIIIIHIFLFVWKLNMRLLKWNFSFTCFLLDSSFDNLVTGAHHTKINHSKNIYGHELMIKDLSMVKSLYTIIESLYMYILI